MNIVERAIARAFPEWGLKRLALEHALVSARAYDAAKRGRRTEGWRATGGSANAEIGGALALVRNRSRDLVRNNEWGAAMRGKLPAHMVGKGIVPRPDTKVKSHKAAAREAWTAFVENCDPSGRMDWYGQQDLVAGTVVESGEALVRWYVRPSSFGLRVPLQCEVLEPDFLDTSKTMLTDAGTVIVQGVEFDRHGRRVAYWLFPTHPGDVGYHPRGSHISQRVDARFVDHVFRVDRPGQVRGVPWLAPAALGLRDLADYEDAEIVRKKIAACLSIFVHRAAGSDASLSPVLPEKGGDRRIEKVSPGQIHYLDYGTDVTSVDPAASDGYAEFLTWRMHAISAGVGLPYANLTGDLSKVSYSSIREGKLDFWALLDRWQRHMLIPQQCRPAWARVMAIAPGTAGRIIPGYWSVPRRPWVDPDKDGKALVRNLRAGLDTWADAVSERGLDPEEQVEEILEWKSRLDEAGVSFEERSAAGRPASAQSGDDDDAASD